LERGFRREGVERVARTIVILPPGERALPPARVAPCPVHHRGRRDAILVDLRLELLGTVKTPVAHLQGPTICWVHRQTEGVGVELAGLDVPAVLVRFSAMEG